MTHPKKDKKKIDAEKRRRRPERKGASVPETVETLSERCKRLCGDSAGDCFVRNQNQISCIADMIVNKLSGILSVMEHAAGSDQDYNAEEFVGMALGNVRQLIKWVKFLQISHDLRVPWALAQEERSSEKRGETRYPFPEIYRKYVVIEVDVSGCLTPVMLLNFSQYGMLFSCPEPLEIDSVRNGVLRCHGTIGGEVPFKVRVRHCTEHDGEYVIGGRVEAVSGGDTLDFFKNVHAFVLEAMMKA